MLINNVRSRAGAVLVAALVAAPALAQHAAYLTTTWSDDSVHVLDDNFNSFRSFRTALPDGGGIATDGDVVWTGHDEHNTVVAYDMDGIQLYRWMPGGGKDILNLQGLEYVGDGQLAVANLLAIQFHDAATGDFIREFASQGATVEGIAWDQAALLFQLADDIVATSIVDGSEVYRIPNPARGKAFGGTGISWIPGGRLGVASVEGDWWIIDAANGDIIRTGNNGRDMYGLATVPAPASIAPLALVALAARRRRR